MIEEELLYLTHEFSFDVIDNPLNNNAHSTDCLLLPLVGDLGQVTNLGHLL